MAKGGKSLNDREKSASVRNAVLNTILDVYAGKEVSGKKWELTLRMATTVLPRLNEHSGPDGDNIPIAIYGGESLKTLPRYDSTEKGISTTAEN